MVNNLKKLNNKGITLIELIVSIGISTILLILSVGIFFTGSEIYGYIYNSIEIQQQGHFIMDFMTTQIMPSTKIDAIKNTTNVSCYKSSDNIE